MTVSQREQIVGEFVCTHSILPCKRMVFRQRSQKGLDE
jgi:hypothetical protein